MSGTLGWLSPDPSEQDELIALREQLARIAARRKRPVANLVAEDRSLEADQVVVATGPFQVPNIPAPRASWLPTSSRRTAPAT